MKFLILAILTGLSASSVEARQESFWVEKVAVIAVGQGLCGLAVSDDSMQTAIGAAMIKHALSKETVIERARIRAHSIIADLQKQKSKNTFCQAFDYYVRSGYPR